MLSELKDVYKKLRNDYNGDILDETKNEEIRRLFEKVSTELKKSDKGNTPLVNIVYNHFHGALPTPNYVSGPFILSYHTSDEYDMKIYIFGEAHGIEKTCDTLDYAKPSHMHISDYLKHLFLNSDKFIDFYIEDQLFVSKKRNRPEYLLQNLIDDYHTCLNPNKRHECIFKTVRTHFVDAREIEKDSVLHPTNPITKLLNAFGEKNYSGISTKALYENIGEIKRILGLKSYESIVDYIINVAINIPIIKKELDRCRLDKRLLISTFRETLLEKYKKGFDIEKFKTLSKDYSTVILSYFLRRLQGPILDIYNITRMFKKFRKTNYFPSKVKYIIFYGGNFHSEVLRIFLRKLSFKENFCRQSDFEASTRCLDMNGIKLDFK